MFGKKVTITQKDLDAKAITAYVAVKLPQLGFKEISGLPDIDGKRLSKLIEEEAQKEEGYSIESFGDTWIELFKAYKAKVEAITYLEVDFKDKDAVKALGAKWDADAKKWYDPTGEISGYKKLFYRYVPHFRYKDELVFDLVEEGEGKTLAEVLAA